MTAREVMLERVRQAVAGTEPAAISRSYAIEGSTPHARVVEAFVERVRDYRATVVQHERRSGRRGGGAGGARSAADRHPAGPRRAAAPGRRRARRGRRASRRSELDGLDGALTTCAAACAVTGTIALDGGPGQGRRALTLLPDLHVCVVREDQIVETVPELVRSLERAAAAGRPLVLVSGPSATSDIELERVEGVHGPRRLVVIVES